MDTSILEFSGLLPPCSYIHIGGRAGLMDTIYLRVSIYFRENITCMTAFHAFFRSCYLIPIFRNATIGSLLAYSVFLYILRHTLRPSDMISYADNPFFGLLFSRTQDIPLNAHVPGSCFRGCRQMMQSQRYIQHICTATVYEIVFFAYRVAIPRQRFNFKNVFST